MNNKGFTLIEVLAVIVIIALLGLISMPSIMSAINTSKNSSYEILVDNIKTAAGELYQELDYMGTNIYRYDNSGRLPEKVNISSGEVTVNLQTLVGNGFLTGSTNKEYNETVCKSGSGTINCNKKVILEPNDNIDIGMCEIKITKVKSGTKVCYKVVKNSGSDTCPTSVDFGGDKQCTS